MVRYAETGYAVVRRSRMGGALVKTSTDVLGMLQMAEGLGRTTTA